MGQGQRQPPSGKFPGRFGFTLPCADGASSGHASAQCEPREHRLSASDLLLKWKKPETLLQDLLTHSQIAGALGHSWDKQIPVCSVVTRLTRLFPSWVPGSHPSSRCLFPTLELSLQPHTQ